MAQINTKIQEIVKNCVQSYFYPYFSLCIRQNIIIIIEYPINKDFKSSCIHNACPT